MRPSKHKEIAKLLLANPDGLTRTQIANAVGSDPGGMKITLSNMYGVYIDRWNQSKKNGKLVPVYCIVEVPENCPRP